MGDSIRLAAEMPERIRVQQRSAARRDTARFDFAGAR